MTEAEKQEKILNKIQKLLKLGSDERGDQHTAEIAMKQALAMMRKHDIEEADLIDREVRGSSDNLVHEEADPDSQRIKEIPEWEDFLATDLSEVTNVGVRKGPGKTGKITIWVFGYKTDVAVFHWLYDYLRDQIEKLCDEAWKPEHDKIKAKKGVVHASERKRWKDKYRVGCFLGLKERIKEVYGEQHEEAVLTSDGRDLMVIKRTAMESKYGKFEHSFALIDPNIVDDTATMQGVMDSDRVAINRVVDTDVTPQLRIAQ